MKPEWSTRDCREGDETGIYYLWQAVYGDRVSGYDRWLHWWRWLYRDNPCGHGRIMLAVSRNRIVGQYAMIPVRMKIGEDIITAGLTLNIMTHPDYRRQGLFENLARTVYQKARQDGISFAYGFPNRSSRPGFIRKLDWIAVSPLRVMIKPLNWENTLRLRLRSKLLRKLGGYGGAMASHIVCGLRSSSAVKDVTVTRASSFDDRINSLWGKMNFLFPCCVVKDQAYLNWRYKGLDDHSQIFIAETSGDIAGYMVVREGARNRVRMAYVFDLLAESEPVLRGMLQKVVGYLRANHVDVMIYQVLTDKAHGRMLARNGFIGVPFVQGVLPGFCLRDISQNMAVDLPRSREKWFVQLGDSDAVTVMAHDCNPY